jgi:hypothetical protein
MPSDGKSLHCLWQGELKSGFIRQVTPSKRSIYMKFDMTRKEKGDLLIQVTA